MLGYNQLLKETCLYEKFKGVNKYNEKEYEAVETVKCFKSFDFNNSRNYQEQEVILTKRVFIGNDFEPNPFDKIDGFEVKSIKPVKGLLAPTIGWEIIV